MYNTRGIDARFTQTDATIVNNLYTGRIARRDGATIVVKQNVLVDDAKTFRDASNGDFSLVLGTRIEDQGATLGDVPDDFCGQPRGETRYDIGAIEYVEGKPTCEVF